MSVTAISRDDGKKVKLSINGRFDFSQHTDFRNSYRHQSPEADYVVDMQHAEYLDSAALGMLLLLREHAGNDSSKVSIINTPVEIMQVFKNSKFENLFKIS
ncbi:MAG: STAS domain-containing protein [Gammaproteobacteria bacterium]